MGKSIGIDLGTTNSGAAIEEGQVRVLPTRMNEPLTPSVVSFRQPRRADRQGIILVGRAALNNAVNAPDQTIFSIKRLMGRSIDDPKVAEVRDRYPYIITEADNPEEDRGVRVELNDVKYTAVDISAMILRQVVEDAERALGADVSHAVITVPAYFSEAQRAATRTAGDQAGLVVKKIIDEPTAAAIAFGMERSEERHRVLVYDMGGGTFDISIIQMVNQQFQVLNIEGDMWLGGDDFDREIVAVIVEWVKEEYDFDPSEDRRFLMLAKQHAERAKIALSGQPEVDLIIPAATRTPDGELVDVDMVITRDQLEKMIQHYVDHSMDLVRKALADQNLDPDDITAVLMVGGATAVPLVHQAVANLFGEERVKRYIDPMQCVALGAGILAARLTGIECPECKTVNPEDIRECQKCGALLASARSVGSIGLGEVTAKSLGISAVGRDGQPGTFAVIIPKGTQYPLTKPMERVFYTTSENLIRVPVYEGEDLVASRNELQGTIEYPLPEEVEPDTPVTVQFNYDKDRVLTVSIRVHGRPDLQIETVLTRDRPRTDFEPDDESWREELEATTSTAEYFLEQYRDYLDRGAAMKMENDIRKARRAYVEGDRAVGKQVMEALHMTVLGSGVASQLFLAERAMDGASPEAAERLARASQELKAAHRDGDRRRVEQISMALQVVAARLFQERASQMELESRDYEGLLREAIF
jgi:molecular chaperone DnaK